MIPHIEEIATGPQPIEGVSTSTAGFVGETERGPTLPRLITSWMEYEQWFGGFIDLPGPRFRDNHLLPYAVRGFFENGGRRLYVARVIGQTSSTAGIELAGTPGPTTLVANGKGDWGNSLFVAVKQAAAAQLADPSSPEAQWFGIQVVCVRDGLPDLYEEFDNLSPDPTQPNYAGTVLNDAARLIAVADCQGTPQPIDFLAGHLQGGTYVPASQADYLGEAATDPALRTGLAGLGEIKGISVLAIPDEIAIPGLASDLVDQCEAMGDRFAILADQRDQGDLSQVSPPRDSSYAAFYYPWVGVLAAHVAEGRRLVPPHGHVAGIYARVDMERGVHRAPANEAVLGIAAQEAGGQGPLSHTVSNSDQDLLSLRGVNVIRDFRSQGRDIRLWGARTMSSNALWKYVHVRRLFIFLEESISEGIQWVVFEPNSETTWGRVRQSVVNFLLTLWRNGALAGAKPEEAFFVQCDRATMTQDDIDSGRLICLIGVAPVKPAEFVSFRIAAKTLEAGTV